MHTMYDLEASGEKRGSFLARFSLCVFPNSGLQGFLDTRRANLAKTSSFWIHIGDILPQRGCFPSEAPFGIHQAKILSRMSAWESFRRIFCHRRHAENASLRYPAPAETWRTHHGGILPPAGHFGACLGEITQKPCPPEAVAPAGASELQPTKASSRPRIKLPTRRPFSSHLLCPCVFRYTRLREAFISTFQRVNRTRTVVLIASLPFFVFDGTIRNEKKFEVAHSRTA